MKNLYKFLAYMTFFYIVVPFRERRVTKAIRLMKKKHHGQVDKGGQPYYLHPMSVMSSLPRGASSKMRVVAILHDILEDTTCTPVELILRGFSISTVRTLLVLTRFDNERYFDYIRRIIESGDPVAIAVKIADTKDNLRSDRLDMLPIEARSLKFRYKRSLQMLESAS